ncbi:MAG: SpoIID/LytB domain-containing protein [Acidobacteriaceae bacterium]|nr:SpoIID/LytB domain-containing protein [Acidobacteriaceae bacterium]
MRLALFLLAAAWGLQAQVTYKVRLTSNKIVELPAEQYVAGVLAGESSTFQSDEALKAMAVAARTYAARLRGRHASEGFDFCATTHCQRFEAGDIPTRLSSAAAATAGELLWFEGKPAFAAYTRDCGGKLESVAAIWPDIEAAYLPFHLDPYCTRPAEPDWSWTASPTQIVQALHASNLQSPSGLHRVVIRTRSESGRAQTLELEGDSNIVVNAGAFRFAIGRELGWNTIRSDLYKIDNSSMIMFHGKGQGHGVGLCQLGADAMGRVGRNYREILAFYYPGTSVSRLATGFHWMTLGGEGVTVLTLHPELDRSVLALAESARRNAEDRLHLGAPAAITIRVYPDIDAFRNATGEPGWVAAHTSASTIDLQPASILNRNGGVKPVLEHEMLHVVLESHAAAGLPIWFREGLVEYLSTGEHRVANSQPSTNEGDLRQRHSRADADHAYAQAVEQVTALISRYGETTVLGWIERGLPADVKYSSDNSAATNSK